MIDVKPLKKIPEEEKQACYWSLYYVALSGDRRFERHFASNKRVLTFLNQVVLDTSNISYFDDAKVNHPRLRRNFRSNSRVLTLPDELKLEGEFIKWLVDFGENKGFPIGFIFNDPQRESEFLSLGDLVEAEFCDVMNFRGKGEIRHYNPNKYDYSRRLRDMLRIDSSAYVSTVLMDPQSPDFIWVLYPNGWVTTHVRKTGVTSGTSEISDKPPMRISLSLEVVNTFYNDMRLAVATSFPNARSDEIGVVVSKNRENEVLSLGTIVGEERLPNGLRVKVLDYKGEGLKRIRVYPQPKINYGQI